MTESIEENTERLDLLQKTVLLEEKQKKRLRDLAIQKEKEVEEANRRKLYEASTPSSVLDHEERQRKELVDEMVQNSTPSLTPVVKVMSNMQGISISPS